MVMVNEPDQNAMEAADKSKIKGIEEVPTTVDPPQIGAVKEVSGASKGKPRTIVVERVTRR